MENDKIKTARMRSPNFPYTSLERAVELVRILFKNYRRSSVPTDTAMTTVELSPKSSKAKQIIAALSAFNLVETEGKGDDKKIKISDLGYNIIIDDRPVSSERDAYLRDAALSPTIFKNIYEKFPHSIPADEVFSHELKVRHSFNPDSVTDFIKVYKQTMIFSKAYESDIIGEETTIKEESPMLTGANKIPIKDAIGAKSSYRPPTGITEHEIANYPIKGGTIRLLASGPITQKTIEKLIKLLDLSKEDFPDNEIEEIKN